MLPRLRKKSKILAKIELEPKSYYLLTLHRAENTDNVKKLAEIIDFVNETSAGRTVVFSMHPRTKKTYNKTRQKFLKNIKIWDPVGYLDLIMCKKQLDGNDRLRRHSKRSLRAQNSLHHLKGRNRMGGNG